MSRKFIALAVEEQMQNIKEERPGRALLTCQDIADLSGHNYETIRRLLDSGAIRPRPRSKPREAYRVSVKEVARYLALGPREGKELAA
ncbi:hypothetical protein WG936_08090 [Corynebacterium sp. H127]|uniref:hypothetical protein n=1 Tax=Corynebacterium sp. H127 TaxID=3133418 RepID=UPI00309F86E3